MTKRSLSAIAMMAATGLLATVSFAQQSMDMPMKTKAAPAKAKTSSAGMKKTPTHKKETKNAFTPDSVEWGPAPAFVPAGAQLAVLEGNPMGPGEYTIRMKTPDGYKVAPHWHPQRENVTIISGAMKVGMGDKFDESKMSNFPAGSFAYLDPSMHHYVMTQGETVIQISGKGPVKFNYVDPKDDPSKAQSTKKKK